MPLEADVDLTIRHAQLGDAPTLAALMCELGYETTTDEMRQRLKAILNDARFRTFVAELDNTVCGLIGTLTHASHEHNDPSGKIVALVVSKKQRRGGIGRALIAAAEQDFAKRKVTRVSLTTGFSREEAHSVLRGARLLANRIPLCKTDYDPSYAWIRESAWACKAPRGHFIWLTGQNSASADSKRTPRQPTRRMRTTSSRMAVSQSE